jgi:hypothetical protein
MKLAMKRASGYWKTFTSKIELLKVYKDSTSQRS